MSPVRTAFALVVALALAGQALAQETLEIRGRSIPENSIERQIVEADLAQEKLGSGRLEFPEIVSQLRLPRSLSESTSDQPLWIVIRRTTEGIAFEEYASSEEASRNVQQGCLGLGFKLFWSNQAPSLEKREAGVMGGAWPNRRLVVVLVDPSVSAGAERRTIARGCIGITAMSRVGNPANNLNCPTALLVLDVTVGRDEKGIARGCIGITAMNAETSTTGELDATAVWHANHCNPGMRVTDVSTGAEVWNQGVDRFATTDGGTGFSWSEGAEGDAFGIGRHIGVPTGRHAERSATETFDIAMLGRDGGNMYQTQVARLRANGYYIGNFTVGEDSLVVTWGDENGEVPFEGATLIRYQHIGALANYMVRGSTDHTEGPADTARRSSYGTAPGGSVYLSAEAENHNSSRSNTTSR